MYKHLDKCIKKRHVYILIILQKVCQNVKLLEMSKKTNLGGYKILCESARFACETAQSTQRKC